MKCSTQTFATNPTALHPLDQVLPSQNRRSRQLTTPTGVSNAAGNVRSGHRERIRAPWRKYPGSHDKRRMTGSRPECASLLQCFQVAVNLKIRAIPSNVRHAGCFDADEASAPQASHDLEGTKKNRDSCLQAIAQTPDRPTHARKATDDVAHAA